MDNSTVIFPTGLTTSSRAGLLVAHPGHELRILGWLAVSRPRVCVMTDGSGHGPIGRMPFTARLVAAAGATPGVVFGRYRDQQLYDLLLRNEHAPLDDLASELSDDFGRGRIDYLVSDAAEGYNTGHDACRLVAAVVARRLGVPHFEFPLTGRPDDCPARLWPHAVTVRLDHAAMSRKLAGAREYERLRNDVQAAFDQVGTAAFAVECLRPTESPSPLASVLPVDPFYERHGQRQVDRGYYTRPIRRAEHLLPLALYLDRRTGGGR